ncbi:hypothetical protein Vi05172_g3215 [Venturia inaequalis]|nr:hypothetical protein Vi05172_g3215 [Venturia inaequalis]
MPLFYLDLSVIGLLMTSLFEDKFNTRFLYVSLLIYVAARAHFSSFRYKTCPGALMTFTKAPDVVVVSSDSY